ncbi:dUTP diphosphatase [Corynebacterium diphtheriae]|nr:dUTP diphosphatase [Corynebacterium diphtheriae]CAB1037408.1 dUTP diphosphatase [Corynebacterium diphtheriae]
MSPKMILDITCSLLSTFLIIVMIIKIIERKRAAEKLRAILDKAKPTTLPMRLISDEVRMPKHAHPTDAGIDLEAQDSQIVPPGATAVIHTGVATAIPTGHFGMLVVRSSFGKQGFSLVNGVGIIDSDYCGEIIGVVRNHSEHKATISKHQRVLQLVIVPFTALTPVERELNQTPRGAGGFGPTGK